MLVRDKRGQFWRIRPDMSHQQGQYLPAPTCNNIISVAKKTQAARRPKEVVKCIIVKLLRLDMGMIEREGLIYSKRMSCASR